MLTATDDEATQQQVFDDAEAAGVWVNAADDPQRCSFFLPAVHRRSRCSSPCPPRGRARRSPPGCGTGGGRPSRTARRARRRPRPPAGRGPGAGPFDRGRGLAGGHRGLGGGLGPRRHQGRHRRRADCHAAKHVKSDCFSQVWVTLVGCPASKRSRPGAGACGAAWPVSWGRDGGVLEHSSHLLKFHGIYQQDDRTCAGSAPAPVRTSSTSSWCGPASPAGRSRAGSGRPWTAWPARWPTVPCG